MFPFSKAFTLSAAAAISTVTFVTIQPAEAISVTRSTGPTEVFTQFLDFEDQTAGVFSSLTLGTGINQVVISDTGPGNTRVVENNAPNTFIRTGNNAASQMTFQFSDYLSYLGMRLLGTEPLPGTISFFRGTTAIDSPIAFSSVSGNGRYFNFLAEDINERFDRVVITGDTVRLDDVAYRVPTPALLPGLIGMGVAALRKRNAEEEQEA